MAASTEISMVLASVFAIILFSVMQIYRPLFASSQLFTILGGYMGSWLFLFAITAVSNLETIVLGSGFQTKLFPEIIFCLAGAVFACGMVHRVCATSCFLFSILTLYVVNRISQRVHTFASQEASATIGKKKRK